LLKFLFETHSLNIINTMLLLLNLMCTTTGLVTSLVAKRDVVLASAIEKAINTGMPLDSLSSDKKDYSVGTGGNLLEKMLCVFAIAPEIELCLPLYCLFSHVAFRKDNAVPEREARGCGRGWQGKRQCPC
jgi:hypothetical protein